MMQEHHLKNGYQLLYTPHVAKAEMWKTSGHLDFYAENMFDRIKVGNVAVLHRSLHTKVALAWSAPLQALTPRIISLATGVSLTCDDGDHHSFPATLSRLQVVVAVAVVGMVVVAVGVGVAVAVHLQQTAWQILPLLALVTPDCCCTD